jgi:branched-chain amino acid transport system substrate-binding protein
MKFYMRYCQHAAAAASLFLGVSVPSLAAKAYSPGASDTEIKIGNTVPYSGPLSSMGPTGRTEAAYFKMLNENGGINGRKITFISYDDAYSPPKTLEQVRKLVESDGVLAITSIIGSSTNAVVMKYLNQQKIPQLFAASGAVKFSDPKNAPWTIGWIPSYQTEGATYVEHILAADPKAKIGILYQHDDFGKDYLAGVKTALKGKPNALVEAPFEVTAPTVDSQIVSLKSADVTALIIAGTGKFASQAIRKTGELGWRPVRYVSNTAVSFDTVLKPAGLQNATGLISTAYMKEPSDPAWTNDPAMRDFHAFMDRYLPGEPKNGTAALGYLLARTLEVVLRQCGDDLTRENVMKQATNLKNAQLPLLLPGIALNTSPTDYSPIENLQIQQFNGQQWKLFGLPSGTRQ